MTPILALARDTGAAVVLVHHANKGDRTDLDKVLGSTALTGSVDNVFLLTRTDRYRILSSVQRIGPDLPERVLTLTSAGDVTADQSRHDADLAVIITAIATALESGSLTRADLLDQLEARRETKLAALRVAVESGTIIRSGTGSKNDPHRFTLPSAADSGSPVPSKSREPESSSSLLSDSPKEFHPDAGSRVPRFRRSPSTGAKPPPFCPRTACWTRPARPLTTSPRPSSGYWSADRHPSDAHPVKPELISPVAPVKAN